MVRKLGFLYSFKLVLCFSKIKMAMQANILQHLIHKIYSQSLSKELILKTSQQPTRLEEIHLKISVWAFFILFLGWLASFLQKLSLDGSWSSREEEKGRVWESFQEKVTPNAYSRVYLTFSWRNFIFFLYDGRPPLSLSHNIYFLYSLFLWLNLFL